MTKSKWSWWWKRAFQSTAYGGWKKKIYESTSIENLIYQNKENINTKGRDEKKRSKNLLTFTKEIFQVYEKSYFQRSQQILNNLQRQHQHQPMYLCNRFISTTVNNIFQWRTIVKATPLSFIRIKKLSLQNLQFHIFSTLTINCNNILILLTITHNYFHFITNNFFQYIPAVSTLS